MPASTFSGDFIIRADPQAPLTFYFEEHVLRLAVVDRESLKLLSTSEWGSPGVYALIEPSGSEKKKTRVYVGKSSQKGGLRSRLMNQNTSPTPGADFGWSRIAAFARPSEVAFNSAQVGYLEGRLTARLRTDPGFDVQAGKQDEDETLKPAQIATLDSLVPTFVAGLRLAGLNVDSPSQEHFDQDDDATKKSGKKKSFGVSVSQLLEVGTLTPGDILVFERKGESRNCTVTADGFLLMDGEEFGSPSSAAVAAYPGSLKAAPGWDVWKLREGGKSLSELRAEFMEAGRANSR